jgi:hypothetical protein
MKVTLRKANVLQNAINDAVKALELRYDVNLNEFEDTKDQIQTARDRFFAEATTRDKLLMSLYDIRAKVARANADSGINDMLTNVAYLEKQISHKQMLASKGVQTSLRVLNGQLNKLKEVKDDGYGYSRRDVVTTIFTEEEVEDFKRSANDLRREKHRLQDTLLELNVQTEIELSSDTVKLLERAGIL